MFPSHRGHTCNVTAVPSSNCFLLQDVVWEKLDAIDGNTVYVGSQIRPPGDSCCGNLCHGTPDPVLRCYKSAV